MAERKPPGSKVPAFEANAGEDGHPLLPDASRADGDLVKATRRWTPTSRDMAVGVSLIGTLTVFSLAVFATGRVFDSDAEGVSKESSVSLQDDFKRAEQEFEKNMRQREEAFISMQENPSDSLNQWRKLHPGGVTREVMFCPSYPCPNLVRIGMWGEGGKWVCMSRHEVNPNHSPVVISVGSRGDASFEQEMSEQLHAFSHTFDFTLPPAELQAMHSKSFLKFHDAGLVGKAEMETEKARWSKDFPNATLLSIDQLMERVSQKRVDLLKLDCEGCEFGVVRDMAELYTRDAMPFDQILVEVHFVSDKLASRGEDLVKSLEKLGYRMFHSEANPYYLECYELSFIHEDLVKPA